MRAWTSASSRLKRLSYCCGIFMGSSLRSCSKKTYRGIPETTTSEPRDLENRGQSPIFLVHGPGEGTAAEPLAGSGFLLEQLTKGLGDVLVNLAVLLRRKARRNPNVAHIEFLSLLAHREPAQVGAARKERLQLLA